ncbi:hypothetical protein B2J69_23400 [Pantoea latae]|uniref:Uncharacterized protein n=1 Tax=Pantoea latae TaxID=1964541 RepID=A0A1V9D771_9GAMM|nr:hypothetical protein B2J69_23400 [Pantoea latae]
MPHRFLWSDGRAILVVIFQNRRSHFAQNDNALQPFSVDRFAVLSYQSGRKHFAHHGITIVLKSHLIAWLHLCGAVDDDKPAGV